MGFIVTSRERNYPSFHLAVITHVSAFLGLNLEDIQLSRTHSSTLILYYIRNSLEWPRIATDLSNAYRHSLKLTVKTSALKSQRF